MLTLDFPVKRDRPARLLCVGAHSDDIEIGCGGTILSILSHDRPAEIHWVVLGSDGERDREARTSAERFLAGAAASDIRINNFRASFFPYIGADVKQYFETLAQISPDVIFTHARHDLHQDHRLVSELTWNTFRNHLILEYEIMKYDGDLGSPNVFVHLDEAICERKVTTIMECFKTQHDKDWFTPDTFLSLLRLRGVESRAPGRYAEAFYCRKLVLSGAIAHA
jgi:LmbE family N-acetylglucosaminyl deacetylase